MGVNYVSEGALAVDRARVRCTLETIWFTPIAESMADGSILSAEVEASIRDGHGHSGNVRVTLSSEQVQAVRAVVEPVIFQFLDDMRGA